MARAKTKSKKKSSVISVDFTGVEGGRKRVPDGDYSVEVKSVEEKEGSDSGEPYLEWQFRVTEGKHEGSVLYYNTSLQPQALWNLKNVLEALGVEGTDSAMDLDLEEMAGYTCQVSVETGEYNGKPKSEVVDIFPIEEEEEKPKPKKSKKEDDEEEPKSKKNKKKGDEDEEEEKPKSKKQKRTWTADAINEMDEDDLGEVIEKAELEVDLDDYPTTKRKRAAVIDALDDADKLDKDD